MYNISMKNVPVKEKASLDSRRSQDLIFVKAVYVIEYDCDKLNLKAICELAAFFEVYFIDLDFLLFFFLYCF
jgi:hypothetical protein